jgi:hypothetical protein
VRKGLPRIRGLRSVCARYPFGFRFRFGFAGVGCAEWVVRSGCRTRFHDVSAGSGASAGGRGRAGGGAYGMMWKKGGIWGLGVI